MKLTVKNSSMISCTEKSSVKKVHLNTLHKLAQAFVREKILSADSHGNAFRAILPKSGRLLSLENVVTGSLNRYVSIEKITINDAIIHHPLELLNIIANELSQSANREKWDALIIEVSDHIRNALVTSDYVALFKDKIQQESRTARYKNFLHWLHNKPSITDKTLFFEQFASYGHPHHPCSKTKLGMNTQDIQKFSPEFYPVVMLHIAAVHKKIVHVESLASNDYANWFAQNYPDTWKQFKQALAHQNLSLHDYLPLPVHPWQGENYVQSLFSALISRQDLAFFENVYIKASPTLSFRTLAPTEYPEGAHIKLPIAVQATSTFRTLSPTTAVNSPRVSRLLEEIFIAENKFDNKLSLLRETYGLHLKLNPSQQKHSQHLTVVFRENVNTQLAPDETCLVVAALFERSPVTDLPLLIELMTMAGVNTLNQAFDYFKQYAHIIIASHLDLYLIYGIGLEGHQQNTLAVFKAGHITRFIARDFGNTDVHRPTLEKTRFSLTPYPGSSFITDNKKDVREAFLHAVYQCHLGEIVLLLAKHYQCSEKLFWDIIKTETQERFEHLKNKLSLSDWQEDYEAILQEPWACKTLFRMRLEQTSYTQGQYVNIINPLQDS